jgi:two-component system NtrC family sensor kinase
MGINKTVTSFLNLPLRMKFILSFLAVICFGGVLTLTLGTRLEHRTIISLAQAKVRHDLASAWMVYNDKLNHIQDIVRLSSSLESLKNALQNEEKELLLRYLAQSRDDFNLDVLNITDARGKILVRSSRPEIWGDDQSQDPLVSRALQGKTVKATQIVPKQELIKEKSLAEKTYLKIIPTPKAAPSPKDYVEDGMFLKAASPLKDQNGVILGVIYGGILLNRNYEIVDRVKEIVFKGEKYKGKEIGTATIFQNDLRISTNVKKENGERAIGTRVSKEVNDAVLQQGKSWIHRAFVVNDWYISAYEPIKNISGDVIGILYVGMLEKPYIDLRNKVMATFAGMAILSVLLLLVIMFFIISTIIQPLQQMVNATKKIADGDLDHKVNINFKDEVGQLASSFNLMTENLRKANEKLVQWGKTLEKRVTERTQELREMQDSLVRSEKLASLGKMAAGVAHEINNPLTSILINTHLVLEKLDKDAGVKENLELIADETTRCSDIVKGLLEFSHQDPPEKDAADVNDILNLSIDIIKNHVTFQNIKIIKKLYRDLPQIAVDSNKIKQVFLNLMLNAAEAMPEGGSLSIKSRLSENEKYVEIEFTDTGLGIPEENINKLFDPFFTTKSGGTGLGLAVSYGIIEQHKGKIEVRSKQGQGSTFVVRLPISSL